MPSVTTTPYHVSHFTAGRWAGQVEHQGIATSGTNDDRLCHLDRGENATMTILPRRTRRGGGHRLPAQPALICALLAVCAPDAGPS